MRRLVSAILFFQLPFAVGKIRVRELQRSKSIQRLQQLLVSLSSSHAAMLYPSISILPSSPVPGCEYHLHVCILNCDAATAAAGGAIVPSFQAEAKSKPKVSFVQALCARKAVAEEDDDG